MYSEKKTAQMAAYLLQKRGGRMAYIKLMKLLYLTDREFLLSYGRSMSGDHFVSMDNGPVLSKTYNLVKAGNRDEKSAWSEWIACEANWELSVKKTVSGPGDDAFDELSYADIKVLNKTFTSFGELKRFEICDLTHKICPEWQDPHGSSLPISQKDILVAGGKTEEEANRIVQHILERDALQEFSTQLS